MNAAEKQEQLEGARERAETLRLMHGVDGVARRMAAEYHACIYAVRGTIYASWFKSDRDEEVIRLA
ncbi:MAG: hypothetical protein WC807_22050 [Hyphomicrobium sp.]|jgi:hypothetical protein